MLRLLPALLLTLLFLAGCSGGQANSPTYDEMKKMMTDALQTEDGKKVLRQTLSDPQFKELLVIEQDEVKSSIEDTLLSKKAEDFWKKQFEDPKFQETVAKSMQKHQEEVMKKLMNDASFQKDMEEFFSSPEMKKQLSNVLQSSDIRKEMEKVVQETIQSPLLQTKWQELILKSGQGDTGKGGESGGSKKQSGGSGDQSGGGGS